MDDQPQPADPADELTPQDAMRALGFDPAKVKAVVLTQARVVAIAADYPEPHVPPVHEEATNARD